MRAVRLVGAKQLVVDDIDDPVIVDPHNAIIDVTATAICGADLLPYWGYVPGFEWGTTMGHEFVGIVREVGPAVAQIKVGDRVVCSSMTSCGTCWYCRRQAQPQCEHRALFGFSGAYPRLDGGQAEQRPHPERRSRPVATAGRRVGRCRRLRRGHSLDGLPGSGAGRPSRRRHRGRRRLRSCWSDGDPRGAPHRRQGPGGRHGRLASRGGCRDGRRPAGGHRRCGGGREGGDRRSRRGRGDRVRRRSARTHLRLEDGASDEAP